MYIVRCRLAPKGNYVDAIDLHAETTESADLVTKGLKPGVGSFWDSLHLSFPILLRRTSITHPFVYYTRLVARMTRSVVPTKGVRGECFTT